MSVSIIHEASDPNVGFTVRDLIDFSHEIEEALQNGKIEGSAPLHAVNSWTGSRLLRMETVHKGGKHATNRKLEEKQGGAEESALRTIRETGEQAKRISDELRAERERPDSAGK